MSAKRVLLVVRADHPRDSKRQLEWLEQNIFPEAEYPKRCLAYVGALGYLHRMTDAWKYDAFDDFEDLYSKLRGEGYFVNTFREPHHFDFALLMHIRRDFASGMGYGLEECRGERCLLRAMFLAARGNVLFGDWGLPLGTLPDVTREKLLERRKLNQYIYQRVHLSRFPDLTANVPFTKVIDHFLKPVYEADAALPPDRMDQIRAATNGKLFTPYQLKRAIWNAWWNMYFARDAYCLIYHRWIHFRYFQIVCVHLYVYFRSWTVSSDWWELTIDSIGFSVMSLLYGVLSMLAIACIDANTKATTVEEELRLVSNSVDPMHFAVQSVVRYAWWMALAIVFFKIYIPILDDRIPILQKLRGLLPYSLLLPLFDVWLHVWSNRDGEVLCGVFMVWMSLAMADLVTHWFFIPFNRTCASITTLSVVSLVWWWRLPQLTLIARWMLEQGLWALPFFIWGRLRLHRELKRSLLFLPWTAAACILLLHSVAGWLS